MDTQTFIKLLPKAEMHLHIEGTVSWMLVRQHTPDPLPEMPEWAPAEYRFPDFRDFEDAMRLGIRNVLASPEGYHQVCVALFQDLVAQNVRYVEASFGADIHGPSMLAEIATAIRAAAPLGLIVRVIGGVNRAKPIAPKSDALADALLATSALDGLDLHGDERRRSTKDFVQLYREARDKWPIVRAHTGELLGADHIRETLDSLCVKRIEHGTTAVHDEDLIQRLIDEDITLDMCPTSNLKLRVVESYASHPIAAFLRRGLRVTVNTDDPAIFGCTLMGELHILAEHQELTQRELAQLQINAFQVATLPEEQRQMLIGEIEELVNAV